MNSTHTGNQTTVYITGTTFGGNAGDGWAGVREPRRPVTPTLSGGAALNVPIEEVSLTT